MKKLLLITIAALMILSFMIAGTFAQDNPGSNVLIESLKNMKIELGSPASFTISLPTMDKGANVIFPGGTIIGDIEEDAETKAIAIRGDASFVLPKKHTGGVLYLKFQDTLINPVEVSFKQYPLKTEPEKAQLDGRPVEIEISADKVFIMLSMKKGSELKLESIKFTEGAKMSDPVTCDCQQIDIDSKHYTYPGGY